jgi:hypothetical protein
LSGPIRHLGLGIADRMKAKTGGRRQFNGDGG